MSNKDHLIRISVIPKSQKNFDVAKAKGTTWGELIGTIRDKIASPGRETYEEYLRMDKDAQNKCKMVGGFVGGTFHDDKRNKESLKTRSVLTYDLDDIPSSQIDQIFAEDSPIWDWTFFAHTTRNHRPPDKERWRIIFPLAYELESDDEGDIHTKYEALARFFSEQIAVDPDLGIDVISLESFVTTQFMYWPSRARDQETDTYRGTGDILRPYEDVLDEHDWQDCETWPVKRNEHLRAHGRKKLGDPREKPGPIGAFCRTYDIEDAIEEFIPDVYVDRRGSGANVRYTFSGGSGRNGVRVYDDGLHLYSSHGTDPVGLTRGCVNAFDLVRIHLYGERDEGREHDDITKAPSYKEMVRHCERDERVRGDMNRALMAQGVPGDDDFEDLTEEEGEGDGRGADPVDPLDDLDMPRGRDRDRPKKRDWVGRLETVVKNGERVFDSCLNNVITILENDERFADVFGMNTMVGALFLKTPTEEMRKRREFDVSAFDDESGMRWPDDMTTAIRKRLEAPTPKGYGLRVTDRDMNAALATVAWNNQYHPLREWLESLPMWDGNKRLDTLFVRHLGCEDNAYHRDVARLTLLGVVARAFTPGHKFDNVPILEGGQGLRKSTFVSILAIRDRWFSELRADLGDSKKIYEETAGKVIVELGELGTMRKSDVNDLKQFVSSRMMTLRAAYDRHARDYQPGYVLIGTTNDRTYLKDPTGNRRFWPVKCGDALIDTAAVRAEIPQLYAEAMSVYRQMRKAQPKGDLPLYLTGEAARTALALQDERKVETPATEMADKIVSWLDEPVATSDAMDTLLLHFEDLTTKEDLMPRQVASKEQIWVRALGFSREGFLTPSATRNAFDDALKVLVGRGEWATLVVKVKSSGRQAIRCLVRVGGKKDRRQKRRDDVDCREARRRDILEEV